MSRANPHLNYCNESGDGGHHFTVTTWTISEKKRIAAEFLCNDCFSFFTREQIESFKNSSHISLADSGVES